MILDRETLKALRASNEYISIYAEWRNGEPTRSEIVGKRKDARGESYANVVWELPSHLEYGSSLTRTYEVLHAYASVGTPTFHELWQTILAMLRTGDDCKLVWSANGHANVNVHTAGLNADHVSLEIVRHNRRLRFHIDYSICPSNTARMFTASQQGTYVPAVGPTPGVMATHGPNA